MDTVMLYETAWANKKQDRIAGEMWKQYQHYFESSDGWILDIFALH